MKKIAFVLLCSAAGFALADETTLCSAHGQERKVELIQNDKGCQVNYSKGADSKTLWSSARGAYCAPHAAEFIEKLKGWGYTCAAQGAAPAATAAQ